MKAQRSWFSSDRAASSSRISPSDSVYQTGDKRLGTITLVRYNGPHGEINRHADGHYNKPHIHRITAAEIASGSTEPQESHREITTRYGTFEQALLVFFDDIAAPDSGQYFPELLQGRLFNGH